MRFFLALMGVEVVSFGAELNGDERTRPVWIDGTGGQYELAEDLSEGDDGEYLPDETCGFGFGGK